MDRRRVLGSGALAGALADARRLGLTNLIGAVLNLAKFVAIAALLSAQEIDVLTAGLLVAVTVAQVAGEPYANHAVTRRGGRRPARVSVGAALTAGLFAVAALAPSAVFGVVAPGLDGLEAGSTGAMRLFCLAGAAAVLLWWAAGEAQRRLDLRGLQAINLLPNGALLIGLVVPVGEPLTRIALSMLSGSALAALLVGLSAWRARGPAAERSIPSPAATWTGGVDDNPLQVHRSGWSVADLRQMGYRVIGVGGHKRLRSPRIGAAALAALSQPFVWRRARHAFELLVVKDTGGPGIGTGRPSDGRAL